MTTRLAAIAALTALLAGCAGDRPSGIVPAPGGDGPRVIWDLEKEPLPEIPFPNDLATRADASSTTGRRLNISVRTTTRFERGIREAANRLEGFSTYGAISVSFERPLDLDNIVHRHRRNRDVKDDVIWLVNIDRRSPRFGELVPLDLGDGNFPVFIPRLTAYWENDPRASVQNLLFDATDEDVNGNGRLDPGEDTDDDGHLDVPNVLRKGGSQVSDLVTFYDKASNTLIARPLLPLQQQTRYAVVLTRNLVGEDGAPVRSPFDEVNHTRQTPALRALPDALGKSGLSASQVAFAWSFTTAGPTRDLEALRAGLYGSGAFARLKREFPGVARPLPVLDAGKGVTNVHILPAKKLQDLFATLGQALISAAGLGKSTGDAIARSFDNVDYFVLGEVTGPNLLADRDGEAAPGYPGDDDEVWQIDRKGGRAFYRPHRISFVCTIPRKDRGKGPPFPVAMYQHGYQSMRLEQMAFSGNIARWGIATCTIDAYGHGLVLPANVKTLADAALKGFGLSSLFKEIAPGRARDLTNDGVPDPGGDFFSVDLFHTRDMLRQTILDMMVVLRALRGFDGKRRWADVDGDGKPDLAGDFNGDGTVDLGGPRADYYTWGTSLGGILSAIFAGIEPAIVAASPQAGGAGLVDIPIRSTQGGIPEGVILRTIGPVIISRPAKAKGMVDIFAIVPTANKLARECADAGWVAGTPCRSGRTQRRLRLISGVAVAPGDRVVLENIDKTRRYTAYAGKDGRFRVQVPADALTATEKRVRFGLKPASPTFKPHRLADTRAAGDRLVITVYKGKGSEVRGRYDRFGRDVAFEGLIYPKGQPLVALGLGFGRQRNTPELRQILTLAQMIIDPGDPINYAPHYARDPLPADYDDVKPGANVLAIVTAGDTNVPVATGVAIARASGALSITKVDPRFGKTPNQVLVDNFVLEGLSRLRRFGGKAVLMDVENFSRGKHAPTAPRLKAPLHAQWRTKDGIQALRIPLLNPRGQHGFLVPNPKAAFDNNTFMINLVGRYLSSGGRVLPDDACMADSSCSWVPKAPPRR